MGVLPKSSIFFKACFHQFYNYPFLQRSSARPSQRNAGVQSIGVTHFLALHLGWDHGIGGKFSMTLLVGG